MSVERGMQVSAKKVEPLNPRHVKNVAFTRKNFFFENLVDSVFQAFEIVANEKDRYRLMNGMAQLLSSDDKFNGELSSRKR